MTKQQYSPDFNLLCQFPVPLALKANNATATERRKCAKESLAELPENHFTREGLKSLKFMQHKEPDDNCEILREVHQLPDVKLCWFTWQAQSLPAGIESSSAWINHFDQIVSFFSAGWRI